MFTKSVMRNITGFNINRLCKYIKVFKQIVHLHENRTPERLQN